MINNVSQIISDFIRIANIAGFNTSYSEIQHDLLKAPHEPRKLPDNYQAIYVFSMSSNDNRVLKIGKSGKNTKARFLSQHYNPRSCNSNLSKSLLNDAIFWKTIRYPKPNEDQIGTWLKRNTDRDNFYFLSDLGRYYLSLFEIFLQCRLNPYFEGG